jgi:hypothetical protein
MSFASPDITAPHALALRIDRLLTRLEREGKHLDPYAAERVQLAIEFLLQDVSTLGGDAILRREDPGRPLGGATRYLAFVFYEDPTSPSGTRPA